MDFSFDLGHVFPPTLAQLVRVNCDMLPHGVPRSSIPYQSLPQLQQRVSRILDHMGRASAASQALKQPITSGDKVRQHPEHTVYLLLDRDSNAGLGSVVGMLKVGRKNLFLLDRAGRQNEVGPLCVLDFYVHESRQRSGCGRRLFEHMLQEQAIDPVHMAVDRPSAKLLAFLDKYYGLRSVVQQVNNYVVFEGFFSQENECVRAGRMGRGETGTPGAPDRPKRARIYMGKLQYV